MDQYKKYTDEDLVTRYYQTQNNYWLGVVLQRYTLLLMGVCMKYLRDEEKAKDAVQQVFYKVLNELPNSKIQLFRAWLYTITKNYCLMQLRAEKNIILEEWKEKLVDLQQDELPHNEIEKDELFTYMNEALRQLNEEQKICVSLFYLNRKTYIEIAEITGFTDTQVKSHIQNGKRNLKISIGKMQQKNGR